MFGFPGVSDDKEFACSAGDLGSIPGLGRSPGEGNGSPLQYSYLKNPLDRGAWQATVHGFTMSRTPLSNKMHPHIEPQRKAAVCLADLIKLQTYTPFKLLSTLSVLQN